MTKTERAFRLSSAVALAALIAACTTTEAVKPETDIAKIVQIESKAPAAADAGIMISPLQEIADRADTQIAANAAKPKSRLAWTIVALRANEALSYLPGTDASTFAARRSKAVGYADAASEACLNGTQADLDIRQGNLCTYAFAVRRINDSLVAGRTFGQAALDKDWATTQTAAQQFNREVDNSWPAYAGEVATLELADQDVTPFTEMAVRSACTLQRLQGQARMVADPAPEPEAVAARSAYFAAIASAGRFVGASPDTPACNDDPQGGQCEADIEIALDRMCATRS